MSAVLKTKVKRTCTRVCNKKMAASSIGDIENGDNILILTSGDYSLIDAVNHILDYTGPADIDWATWTQGVYDQGMAYKLFNDGRIKSVRWLVDPSMFQRRAELSGAMIERFGVDSFRAVSIHAKFVSIRGENFSVAIRTSMNMNENKKCEHLEITACGDMAEFLKNYTDSVFSAYTYENKSNSRKVFQQILSEYRKQKVEENTANNSEFGF